jgi:hypothetical protein
MKIGKAVVCALNHALITKMETADLSHIAMVEAVIVIVIM